MGNDKKLKVNKYFLGIFITLILMFPIIMKIIQHIIFQGFNVEQSPFKSVVNIIVQNFSFYATALSITFTVFVFNQTEHQRIETERKLKEKEREQLKDKYRPTFIVEENNESCNIKLLMRDNDLYLENIKYYRYPDDLRNPLKISNLKSGEVLAPKDNNSFYITAKTQIGENILFGYLNNDIKIHKYLKDHGNAIYPREGFKNYNQDEVDKNWGNYNIVEGTYHNLLDQVFFYNTIGIREKLVFNFSNAISSTLESYTANKFFKSVFKDILEEFNSDLFKINNIREVMKYLLDEIEAQIDFINIDQSNQKFNYTYINTQLEIINKNGLKKFDISFYNKKDELINLLRYLKSITTDLINHDDLEFMNKKNILRSSYVILNELFTHLDVNEVLDDRIIIYKTEVCNILQSETIPY
jgi:hypothetical protein